MESQRKLLITIAIFFSFFLQSPHQTKSQTLTTSLLNHICHKTLNPNFCVKTLESDPRTSKATTVLSVAKIALDLSIKNSIQTRGFINRLVNKISTPHPWKPALKECVTAYNLVAMSFKSAYGEVDEGEYESANYDIMVVFDDVGECETALAKAKVQIKSVYGAIQVTKDFTNIGDTVTSLLWNP